MQKKSNIENIISGQDKPSVEGSKTADAVGGTGRKKQQRLRPTVAENGPHPVDVHVGSRVRLARLLAGRPQEWLGQQVGLTFQQIQKYERGANRVSCSMLSEFAAVLNRPVAWFFESDVDEVSATPDTSVGDRQRLTYELTSNFQRIANEKARDHIVGLVRAIAAIDQKNS